MVAILTPENLGTALRLARKRIPLTQPELALAAGVGVRFIVDLEGGKPTVQLARVLRVIDALGGSLHCSGLDAPLAGGQTAGAQAVARIPAHAAANAFENPHTLGDSHGA